MTPNKTALSRRDLLRLALSGAALGVSANVIPRAAASGPSVLTRVPPSDRKLLFVLCAYGGASIIDSFLAVPESATGDFFLNMQLNTFPDGLLEQKPGSAFRVPKLLDGYGIYAKPKFSMGDFVSRHGSNTAVIAQEVSSVNHVVGQQRALNGAGLFAGRTLMEAVALRYGGGLPLPNCNMASDGYLRHGVDPSVPLRAKHEIITAPVMFAAGTDPTRAVAGVAADFDAERALGVRDELERASVFGTTFGADVRRGRFLDARRSTAEELSQSNLFEKLFLFDPTRLGAGHGISADPVAQAVRAALPNLDKDKLEAQVGLGFLLAFHGVSAAVTIGASTDPYITDQNEIVGSPLSFDFSHQSHREVQNLMWCRTLRAADQLITLLKTYDYMGDPALGKMWDRSLVYIATEFGRDKARPALSGSWGTGHHLNNGSVLISPLLRGNAIYGGVDPKTCLTYGFDPQTGQPTPGKNLGEADVFGIIAQALKLGIEGIPRYDAVVRAT